MDTIKFLIQGSADEPYQVTFTKEGDVETILKWLVGSDVEAAMDVVHEATRLALDAKKNLQQAKKNVAKAMRT